MPPPSLQPPPRPRPLAQPGSLCKNQQVLWHLSLWSRLLILLFFSGSLPGPPAHLESVSHTHTITHCHSQRHQHPDTLLHAFKMQIPTYGVPPSYTHRHCQIHTDTQSYLLRPQLPPAPFSPQPHQALPQRLLFHGWYNLRLNVHVQVKFQGEALLAWVLSRHASQRLHP